jgi:hypothetical protein
VFRRLTQVPSQSVSPAVQLARQRPASQTWLDPHALPHWPQLLGSARRLTQAPLQLKKPGSHWHPPLRHRPLVAQAVPQLPQSAESVCGSTHRPPQSRYWEGQVGPWHCPWAQGMPGAQALLHAPQSFGLVWRLTHVLPQTWRPGAHAHWPPAQVWPAAHAWPHWPQLWGSEAVLVQVPPQTCDGGGHRHSPPSQVSPAAQTVPHVPQLKKSELKSTH